MPDPEIGDFPDLENINTVGLWWCNYRIYDLFIELWKGLHVFSWTFMARIILVVFQIIFTFIDLYLLTQLYKFFTSKFTSLQGIHFTGLHCSAYQPGQRHQTSLFPKLTDKLQYEVLGIIQLPSNKDIYH